MGTSTLAWEPISASRLPRKGSAGLHLLLFPNHFTKFKALGLVLSHYVPEGFILYLDLELNSPFLLQETAEDVKKRLVFVRDDEPERLRLGEFLSASHRKLKAYFVDSLSSLYFHYIPLFPKLDPSRTLITILALMRRLSMEAAIPYLVIHTTQQWSHASRRFKPLSERLWSYAFDTTTSFRLDQGRVLMLILKARDQKNPFS